MEQNQVEWRCDGDIVTSQLLEGLRGRPAAVIVQTSARSVHAHDSSIQGVSVSR